MTRTLRQFDTKQFIVMPLLAAAILIATFSSVSAQPPGDRAKLRARLLAEARELLPEYPENDRNVLASALIEMMIAQKDREGAFELAVDLNITQAHLFTRIASTFMESGNDLRALQIVMFPTDTAIRNQAVRQLPAYDPYQGSRTMVRLLESLPDSALRFELMLAQASQQNRPARESALALRQLLPRLYADTTENGQERMVSAGAALLFHHDMTGFEVLKRSKRPLQSFIYQVGYTTQNLAERGDPFADSLYVELRRLIALEPNAQMRDNLESQFQSAARPRKFENKWRAIADTIVDRQRRINYLASQAQVRMQYGTITDVTEIADYMLAIGDSARARQTLINSASYGSYWNSPLKGTLPQALEALQRAMAIKPGSRQTFDSEAQLARMSVDFARTQLMDPAFVNRPGQLQDAVLNCLMNVDVQAAVAGAIMIQDSTRRDSHLRNAAQRLSQGGMLDAALEITARIRTPATRVSTLGQIVQQPMQSGDTTRVQAIVREALSLTIVKPEYYQFTNLIGAGIYAGMQDEIVAWADQLPRHTRAYAVVALLTKLPVR